MSSKIMFLVVLCVYSTLIFNFADAGNPWTPEERKDTLKRHEQLLNQTNKFRQQIHGIFLGDSITEGWLYNGKSVWEKYYEPRNVYNYGIGGDRTEHVLWRIENGEFDGIQHCNVIVLMIGTNNIGTNTPADISKGVQTILQHLQQKMQHAKILLLSVFPRGGTKDQDVHKINSLIEKLQDNQKVFYMDVTKNFETSEGKVIKDFYVQDELHLTEKGYENWYKTIETEFSKLLQ